MPQGKQTLRGTDCKAPARSEEMERDLFEL